MSDLSANISGFRQRQGLSQEAFASRIGYPKAKIQNIEAGKQRADHDFLAAIAVEFTVNLNDLLGVPSAAASSVVNDTPYEFAQIPRYQVAASAGHGALVETEETSGSYAFNLKWLERRGLKPANLCVISVRGDSMEPRLGDGDLILVDRAQRQIADGLAYVMRIGDDLLVKNVQRIDAARIALLSANTLYPPRELDLESLGPDPSASAEVIGRVVASMQEW